MRHGLFALFSLTACAGAAPTPDAGPRPLPPPPPSASASASVVARCDAGVDVAGLLRRHAQAYGSSEAVRASMPRSSTAMVDLGGQRGEAEQVVADGRSRGMSVIGGFRSGNGVDARGPWILDGSGVPLRVAGVEATAFAVDDFLTQRMYLTAPLTTTCVQEGERALVHAKTTAPTAGEPELVFDLATAALVEVTHTGADGTRTVTAIESWTPRDAHGVRWPRTTRDRDEIGNVTVVTETSARDGIWCTGATGEACLAMPGPEVDIVWGPTGTVRVPFVLDENELLLRLKVDGREVWGLLDSGASTSAIDATRPVVAGFRPGLTIEGSGVDQTMKIGLGTLGKVTVGDLSLAKLPVASVPLPTLDSFEARRPEIILGFTVFAAGVVRVDFAKSEIAFAQTKDGLVGAGATAIPIRVLDGKPVLDASIEGHAAVLEIDTGNNGGVQLTSGWAAARKLPGNRPAATLRGLMGAGTQETESQIFRVRDVRFGDQRIEEPLVGLMSTPAPGIIAGLLGNELLGRCPAVIFDVPARTLWLEGPCTRDPSPSRSGMRLAKHEDKAHAGRPWIVGGLVPTGSAERAGLREGDRLLEIGGKPATSREQIDNAFRAPKGTMVKVQIARGSERKTIDVKLVDALGL